MDKVDEDGSVVIKSYKLLTAATVPTSVKDRIVVYKIYKSL